MLDLSLEINNCQFKLAHPVDWTRFNSTIESQNRAGFFFQKVKVRKLGWFRKWHEGGAEKGDELYKMSNCMIQFLEGRFGLVPVDATSPFGPCYTSALSYVQGDILRKINIFATSPNLPKHNLPSWAELLMGEFNGHCYSIFGQPGVLPKDARNRASECFVWLDSESGIRTSTFYRKIFVVTWEIL